MWRNVCLGKPSFKKNLDFMKTFHKWGGVSRFSYSYSDFIYPIIYEFIYGKNLNKDFTNTIRGGGVTILWKFFIKNVFFFNDGFPNREKLFFHKSCWA